MNNTYSVSVWLVIFSILAAACAPAHIQLDSAQPSTNDLSPAAIAVPTSNGGIQTIDANTLIPIGNLLAPSSSSGFGITITDVMGQSLSVTAVEKITSTVGDHFSLGMNNSQVNNVDYKIYAVNEASINAFPAFGTLEKVPNDDLTRIIVSIVVAAGTAIAREAVVYVAEFIESQPADAAPKPEAPVIGTVASIVGLNIVSLNEQGATLAPSSIEMLSQGTPVDQALVVGTATDGTNSWILIDASNVSQGGLVLEDSLPLHNTQHTPSVNQAAMAIAIAASETVALFYQGQGPDNATCTITKAIVDGSWQIIGYGIWIPTATITNDVLGDFAMWSVRTGREGWVTAFSRMKQSKLLNISKSLQLEFGPGNVVRELIGCDQVPQPPSIDQNAPPPSFVQ